MKIDFIVGEIERHEMELSFDQRSGDLRLLMDGTQLLQDRPSLAVRPVCYELNVGNEERHKLAFQVAYGRDDSDPHYFGFLEIPRLSLMVTALAAQGSSLAE